MKTLPVSAPERAHGACTRESAVCSGGLGVTDGNRQGPVTASASGSELGEPEPPALTGAPQPRAHAEPRLLRARAVSSAVGSFTWCLGSRRTRLRTEAKARTCRLGPGDTS